MQKNHRDVFAMVFCTIRMLLLCVERLSGSSLGKRHERGLRQFPFRLVAQGEHLLHLLKRCLVALQCLLQILHRYTFALSQLLQHGCILLLLLKHLAVESTRLVGLLDQLLNDLSALRDLLACLRDDLHVICSSSRCVMG